MTAGRNLVLIGLTGVGKSTVGQLLGERLGRAFVDSDSEVARAAGMSVPEVFARHGEARFRQLEAAAVRQLAASPGRVVAVGGGAVLADTNVVALRRTGDLVWLDADPALIAARLEAEEVKSRPLLAEGAATALARLRDERDSAYRRAAATTVPVDGLAPVEVADRVLAWARTVPGLLTAQERGR